MDPADLHLIPLGGLGEVGMNCLALESSDGIVLIDCGVTFPSDGLGVDIARPRFDYLFEHRERVRGVVITHGHEDHIGALPYLLEEINVPIWAPPHSAELIRGRLNEWGLLETTTLHVVRPRERFEVAGTSFEPIRVTHSITEATALAIRRGDLTLLHTGDFKLDPNPADGERTDEGRLREIGDQGVRLLLSDSTNVDSHGESLSELEVGNELLELVSAERGRVVIGLFASNVQRLLHLGEVARKTNRRIVLAGRSLHNHVRAATAVGKLAWPSDLLVPLDRAGGMAKESVLVLATGTQAEPLAALARLANETHPKLRLDEGDAVLFSSRVIPGNERAVHDVFAGFLRRGIKVISRPHRPKIHASGHAHRGELVRMMELIRPQSFIPLHGTLHHLFRHADLAREQGISEVLVMENGDVVKVSSRVPLRKHGRVASGRVFACDKSVVPSEVLDERRALAQRGAVTVTLLTDRNGKLVADPTIIALGVLSPRERDVLVLAKNAARKSYERLRDAGTFEEAALLETVRLAVRAAIEQEVATKTQVFVSRVAVQS